MDPTSFGKFNLPQLLADARSLIAIPSITSDRIACNEALFTIQQKLAAVEGLTIEFFEQEGVRSLLAYMGPDRPERFTVLLNGHVDVVPAPVEMFQAIEKTGMLHGRGSLDMKVAVLVLTELFCELAPHLDYPLGLQISTDEEVNGYNGARYQHQQGVRCDFMVSGERTNLDITVAAKGICWARLRFKGASAHAGYMWDGDSAIVSMKQAMDVLLAVYPAPTQEAWRTTANIATISTSNTTLNKVPDDAMMEIDFRYVPDDPHFANEQTLIDFLQSLHPAAEPEIIFLDPSFHTPEDNPFIQQLATAITEVTRRSPTYLQRHGTADVRFYNEPDNGVVTFGLRGGEPHSDHEYVDISSIEEYYRIMKSFLLATRGNTHHDE